MPVLHMTMACAACVYGRILCHGLKSRCQQYLQTLQTQAQLWTAEVISTVGFEKDLDALQVETGSDGKIRLAHQPFLEVSLQLLYTCCSILDQEVLPHAKKSWGDVHNDL